MMGIFSELFGEMKLTLGAEKLPLGYDFQGMAAQRMAYGYKPIDWKQILLNQLRAESYLRPLSEFEQFLFDSLLKDAQNEVQKGVVAELSDAPSKTVAHCGEAK